MYLKIFYFFIFYLLLFESSCDRNENEVPDKKFPEETNLRIVIEFDSTQERLDNNGEPAPIAMGHQAQSTNFNSIYIKAIKFLKDSSGGYDSGADIYYNPDLWLASNGTTIDNSISAANALGAYNWIRVYFYQQKYQIKFKANGNEYLGTLLSFLWPENDGSQYLINDSTILNDSIIPQGSYYLELTGLSSILHSEITTQITQPNSLHYSWPSPANLYVVTCPISPSLVLNRPDSKTITISISTNKCFEWIENSDPAFFEPFNGDTIVDFGVRGIRVIQ
ncbi:MAG: hypothetical protein ABI763_02420 [Bacteroidota bacterium]